MTARIVSAHVSSNKIAVDGLPKLIAAVSRAFVDLEKPQGAPNAKPEQQPAVPVKRSIQVDYLICLEDGAKLRVLKRYLQTRFGLSPQQYRAKWGLPGDYPIVAPSYAQRRSALAKELGLGRKRAVASPPKPAKGTKKTLPARSKPS